MEEDLIKKKATLALGGGILLPEGFEVPVRVSHSTAGPGAGSDSVAISFDGMRVKKGVSHTKGEFELHINDDGSYSLTHGGEPFLDRVEFEPVAHHCPGQSFFTLDNRCGFRCAFCASPRLPESDFKHQTDAEIAAKAKDAHELLGTVAVSLTTGVPDGDVDAEVDRMVSCIRAVRAVLPDIPIGIEPYVSTEDHVRRLKEAGATEIKLNIQTATAELMEKVCPDLDRGRILDCLGFAVKYFGRGKVSSNIIFGLGETDGDVEECMRMLCGMDVIPTVRGLRYNNYNRESLAEAIGDQEKVSPERMIRVAKMQKSLLEEYGLDTRSAHTMCLECGCCDIVPFRDLRSQTASSRGPPRTRRPCSASRCRAPRRRRSWAPATGRTPGAGDARCRTTTVSRTSSRGCDPPGRLPPCGTRS